MLNSYELNGAALNGRVLRVVAAAGIALAVAGAVGNEFVTRYTPASVKAVATAKGTAYPIYPSGGSIAAFAFASCNEVNAQRPGKGYAQATAKGVGLIEAEVFASGSATATATLVGIPASDIGSGNATATATLAAHGNRVKFDKGHASANAVAVNTSHDVVRYAQAKAWSYAHASGEPAVNEVLDASGQEAYGYAYGEADTLVLALSEGDAFCSAQASGYGNVVKRDHGAAVGVASLTAGESLSSIAADGHMLATASMSGEAVRTVLAQGQALAKALHFANARAFKKGRANISVKATLSSDIFRVTYGASTISAQALMVGEGVKYLLASSDIEAIAVASAIPAINPFTYAPLKRTVIVRAYSPRLVQVGYELREIRVSV